MWRGSNVFYRPRLVQRGPMEADLRASRIHTFRQFEDIFNIQKE